MRNRCPIRQFRPLAPVLPLSRHTLYGERPFQRRRNGTKTIRASTIFAITSSCNSYRLSKTGSHTDSAVPEHGIRSIVEHPSGRRLQSSLGQLLTTSRTIKRFKFAGSSRSSTSSAGSGISIRRNSSDTLEHFDWLWNILGREASALGVFFSASRARLYRNGRTKVATSVHCRPPNRTGREQR